ncbi:hypothetical protein [Campylobacter insulaenigrae]|uniref:hypothetical protein n=1 Tax=Campylobacter insulaenigrae TaxID=260714 RepID=UPI00215239EC|nr:hypothetical protein [Campylobacter insulaenigrae]MCR6580361.1 hypothetical protein [Campylobacter insulaenigrae]
MNKYIILFLFFNLLILNACSSKYQGKYDELFNDKKGWIPVNTQSVNLNEGTKDEK